MTASEKFNLIYAPITKDHLRAIESKYYSLIRKEIETQLRLEPDARTPNRRSLKRPAIFGAASATWEVRFGPQNRFRLLYRVNREDMRVNILAIGEKEGQRLLLGGEEIELRELPL
jgi:mRNA-degrading endonuclease RelE of RelBE toxin-antitoxin system